MNITPTEFEGLLILEPACLYDSRGFFMEAYNEKMVNNRGIPVHFIQDNQSYSKKGVIRGLHFQKAPYAQTKLVRVLSGVILDVVVDLRKNQPTYKKVCTIELSAVNRKQLLVPKGFAHGFSVLSPEAEVLYKIDEYYHPEAEEGIFYNDPDLGIDWQLDHEQAVVSEKDLTLPLCKDVQASF
jgi:dTDP-4-dehydrorhamnose 3,5-epimerase